MCRSPPHSPPPPPPPLSDCFRAGTAVARQFALPMQTPWRRPCSISTFTSMKGKKLLLESLFFKDFSGAESSWIRSGGVRKGHFSADFHLCAKCSHLLRYLGLVLPFQMSDTEEKYYLIDICKQNYVA